MGRQLAVKLSRKKEEEFSQFLKEQNCVIVLPWSERKKINEYNYIPPAGPRTRTLYIWNKKFKFKPLFVKIKKEYKQDKYNYGLSTSGKPLIEYSRESINRIYWEKYFTTSNPKYNVEEFENWYDKVINWFKKNCKYTDGIYEG